jgi:hypothetical protein
MSFLEQSFGCGEFVRGILAKVEASGNDAIRECS